MHGFILFVIGIIVAILGSAKVPAEVGGWPDTWGVFLAGGGIALVGLALWRRHTQQQAKAQSAAVESANDPFKLLQGLADPMETLKTDLETLDTDELTARVDALLNQFVLPFAQVRQVVLDRLGMEKGAEILVVVAFGERLLNRVWTAAADGHLPEAQACFPEAHEAFIEAQAMLAAATTS
ncbi:MAG: hypothetical protein QF464_20200 [Myxococcota bacterium]|nr:hypothetical protein [Myxococcota bacterium]